MFYFVYNLTCFRRSFVYVGDHSGQITVLKLDGSGVQFVNILKGQSGSIQCLCWDGEIGWLFSGKTY